MTPAESTWRGCDRDSRSTYRVAHHIGSTMSAAGQLAESGAPSGTVAGAEEQTAGQGRHGRSWHSSQARGCTSPSFCGAASIQLRCPWSRSRSAWRCAMRSSRPPIWPATCAGPTCTHRMQEVRGHPHHARILGYHCRHRHQRESFGLPAELSASRPLCASPAAAFNRASGCLSTCSRVSTPTATCLKSRARTDPGNIRARIQLRFGRRVCVDQDGSLLRGTTAGLNDSGFLILRGDDGANNLIVAGGVRPCS